MAVAHGTLAATVEKHADVNRLESGIDQDSALIAEEIAGGALDLVKGQIGIGAEGHGEEGTLSGMWRKIRAPEESDVCENCGHAWKWHRDHYRWGLVATQVRKCLDCMCLTAVSTRPRDVEDAARTLQDFGRTKV